MTDKAFCGIYRRAACLLLALALFLGLVPGEAFSALTATALAASADNPYEDVMNSLVDWGVMQGYEDGSLRPDGELTRAEFVAMINRAYGYTDKFDDMPFTDVQEGDWYYDDIETAYGIGYFKGTAANLASPNEKLTREQAMVLLARNMRMEEQPGEVIDFDDGHDFQSWSAPYVNAALSKSLIGGYDDGTFRPGQNITRGEMSVMLYNALGNVVNTAGDNVLGDVFGNVTINTPGVTLRDTTIAGDLYVSGGLGLGGVKLENVRVLGDIIVSGTGQAEGGEDSVILNNVEAQKLLVDNMSGQALSLSVNGDTVIDRAVFKSDAFITDRTASGLGLLDITLEGNDLAPGSFTVSGNIESLTNKAPESVLQVSAGAVQTLTVDEEAVGSSLILDSNATVRQLNLDTATDVSGLGAIDRLTVSANGSTIEMLPDVIDIRPGITAQIAGQEMDRELGEESGEDPRLLAGYPVARSISPTNCVAVFSGNKAGTVYWAVSTVADGSVGADDLITTPAYGSKALASGSLRLTASETEAQANVTGLIKGGSYYLSAVLVDSRGQRSPVKVYSFSTPDDTVPAFLTGYPRLSRITKNSAQMEIMVNKGCVLYWAVLPEPSVAPTAEEFKANNIGGTVYGYGTEEVDKNTPYFFTVNQQALEEQKTYGLYVWLTDADGGKSSAVQKISFTTLDGTAPVINDLRVTKTNANSLEMTVNLSEPGTFYYVAVNSKNKDRFPSAPVGSSSTAVTDETAIIQIINASGAAVVTGKSVAVSTGNADTKFTVTGLQPQTEYIIWYVARDKAGNTSAFSQTVAPVNYMTVKTLDNVAPTVRQAFSNEPAETENTPYPDTGIDVIFSEKVRRKGSSEDFLTLYEKKQAGDEAAGVQLLEDLRACFALYSAATSGRDTEVSVRQTDNDADWTIDYRNAQVLKNPENEDEIIVRFPYLDESVTGNEGKSATNLNSATTYYFKLSGVTDTSDNATVPAIYTLSKFTTIAAQALLVEEDIAEITVGGATVTLDTAFSMTPMSITRAGANTYWDMVIWTDTTMMYDLYWKEPGGSWEWLGSSQDLTVDSGQIGRSLWRHIYKPKNISDTLVSALQNNGKYEFGVHLTSYKKSPDSDRDYWNIENTNLYVDVITGSNTGLNTLADKLGSKTNFNSTLADRNLTNISYTSELRLPLSKMDDAAPYFIQDYPKFNLGAESGTITVATNTTARVLYMVAPVTNGVTTTDMDGTLINSYDTPYVPYSGSSSPFYLYYDSETKSSQLTSQAVNTAENPMKEVDENPKMYAFPVQNPTNAGFSGFVGRDKGEVTVLEGDTGTITLNSEYLEPNTEYFAYFILVGGSNGKRTQTLLYKFKTTDVEKPTLTVRGLGASVSLSTNITSTVYYALINYNANGTSMDASLTAKFDDAVKSEYKYKDGDANDWTDLINNNALQNKLDEVGYDKFTVLDAMAIDISGVSLFDMYADETYAQDVYTYLANAKPDSNYAQVVEQGSQTLNANGTISKDYSNKTLYINTGKIIYNKEYAFIAMGKDAKSSDSISSWSFRATYPVVVSDSSVPQIYSVSGPTISVDDAGNVTASGDLTFYFTQALYEGTTSGGNVTTPLGDWAKSDDSSHSGKGKSWENYIYLKSSTSTEKVTAKHETSDCPVDRVSFTVTGLAPEGKVTFRLESSSSAGLSESSGNRFSFGTDIYLTLVENTDTSGNSVYTLTLSLQYTSESGGNRNNYCTDSVTLPLVLDTLTVKADPNKQSSVPKVNSVSINIDGCAQDQSNASFSGTVKITFDQPLYYKNSNGRVTLMSTSYLMSSGTVGMAVGETSVNTWSAAYESRVVTVTFNAVNNGSTVKITMPKNTFCNAQGNYTDYGVEMDDLVLAFQINGDKSAGSITKATVTTTNRIDNTWWNNYSGTPTVTSATF